MIRLGALTLATLAALFLALSIWGEGNPRAGRRPPADLRPAAQDAGPARMADAPALPPRPDTVPPGDPLAAAAPPSAEDPARAVAATVIEPPAQTPRKVQRFPGPPLQPAPGQASRPESSPLPAGGTLYVAAERVNMRAGPSTRDAVVAPLGRGAALQPVGAAAGEWVQVRDGEGRQGFVAARFLSGTAP